MIHLVYIKSDDGMKVWQLILLIIFLAACSADGNDSDDLIDLRAEGFPQRWELIAMSGMVANIPPSTGADMEWQEHYILFVDNTFVKLRVINNRSIEDNGTFSIVELSDGKYIEFTYKEKSELVGNCSNQAKEFLRFESETELVGTWWACDGPGMFYVRTE